MGVNRSNTDQYQLRLPPGLRERIKEAADRNSRSMNTEIVTALEEAFPPADRFLADLSLIDEIDDLAQRLERIRAARMAEEIAKGRVEIKRTDAAIERADQLLGKKKPKS